MGTGRAGELAGRAGATQPGSDQPSSSQFTPGPGQPGAGATDQPGGETVSRDQLAAWGVEPAYFDATGRWCEAPEPTLRSIMRAMGAGEAVRPPEDAPLLVIAERGPWQRLPPGKLELEGGGAVDLGLAEERPPALPPGYHRLRTADGGDVAVAVCPPQCPGPPPGRSWGWSVQLYAARSRSSWGIGDFADLATLAEWAAANGARFLLINPLHAPAPGPVPEDSPYFPSSRSFLNPLYLSVADVPGAKDLPNFSELDQKAKELNDRRLIERAQVWRYKSQALEAAFALFERKGGTRDFDHWIALRGKVLDGYTTFCALAELFGLPWQNWPEIYRHPSSPAVARLGSDPATSRRKRYHAWLQWTCEQQLERAAKRGVGLVMDLAVGVDGSGADAWLWQDTFALSMRVGAPPDGFNLSGQDWGLPPWVPWKLRAAAYEPYIEVLRAVLRPAMGLRVDHVMGLFRLYWVPLGQRPSEGTYVRFPWEDMLGLLRLEASRAGAFVVGEDLGTVQPEVREALAQSGVLSYRLLWFEERQPAQWPRDALGAVTTHDLPTVAGVWTGYDFEAQRKLGLAVDEANLQALRRRLAEWTGSADGRPVEEVIEATYALLASAPCSLVAAVLEDAAGAVERPNMPGTAGARPNWRVALPKPLEEIATSELAGAISRRLGAR